MTDIDALAAELREARKRVLELEAEIEVRDNCTTETMRILREAMPNRGFYSEMDAAEAAAKELSELRASNAKLAWAWDAVQDEDASRAADKAKTISAAVACLNSLAWLDARDRRMKALGAAEWIRAELRQYQQLFGLGDYRRSQDGMEDEAERLEQRAAELEAAGEGERND